MIAAHDTQRVHSALIDVLVAREVERQIAEHAQTERARMDALQGQIDALKEELAMARRTENRLYAEKLARTRREFTSANTPFRKALRHLAGIHSSIIGALAVTVDILRGEPE